MAQASNWRAIADSSHIIVMGRETKRTAARPAATAASLRESLGIDENVLRDIRAAGECLGDRVPELIERFYEWLSAFPEFAQFFGSEPALLARVQSHQTAYWRDFLRAKVDDEYVERRRVVGLAHARIELGLLIYLRAMEFVEAWLIQETEAHEALLDGRPTLAFSIRKLVHFDSAIVVHTYATRTARLLEDQRERLHRMATVMHAVTEGDLNHEIDQAGPDDVLGNSVNDMVKSLRDIAREMGIIAKGDYSADVAPRSAKDELGISLQAMTHALRDAAENNEHHLWMATSLAELGQAMSGNPTVKDLSQGVVTHLCRVLDCQVGAFYVAEDARRTLRLAGTYAVADGGGVRQSWKLGEGLIGQAAQEKRRILVSHMPKDCLRIQWGIGEAVPSSLVLVPLIHEDELRGVVELGSLAAISERQLEFLDKSSASVALAITAAETRAQLQQLLEESQAQAEELTQQQEELRSVNEILEEQTRALELQKESLVATETVLRQKASELQRASQYKSEFLANMSHELRTPLNSSLILAKLLGDNKAGNLSAEQVKYAESIYSAGNDLLVLINDILDLSKIEAGKLELNIDTVNIDRLMGALKLRFDPLIADKDVELFVAIEQGCPNTIETDVQRLQQILTNLLSNAVKFTAKGSIRLRVARRGSEHITFIVEDSGVGIPAEQHQVIFDAFRQADGSTSRKFGGTGLGLSICRELADLLGGEITLCSTVGEGSVFTLLIPLRRGAVGDAPRSSIAHADDLSRVPPSAADVPEFHARPFVEDDRNAISDPRRVVLVIEDDPIFAQIVRDLAREFEFQCVVAGTANEGMHLAREYRPVAIVLDIGLPDGSGLTVLEA